MNNTLFNIGDVVEFSIRGKTTWLKKRGIIIDRDTTVFPYSFTVQNPVDNKIYYDIPNQEAVISGLIKEVTNLSQPNQNVNKTKTYGIENVTRESGLKISRPDIKISSTTRKRGIGLKSSRSKISFGANNSTNK